MAREQVLVDAGDLQAARDLVEAAIEYMEQELGIRAGQPVAGRLERKRLWLLRRDLDRLKTLIRRPPVHSSHICTS